MDRKNGKASGILVLILSSALLLVCALAAVVWLTEVQRASAPKAGTGVTAPALQRTVPVRSDETAVQQQAPSLWQPVEPAVPTPPVAEGAPESSPEAPQTRGTVPAKEEASAPQEELGLAERVLAKLTLREKLYQMTIAAPSALTGVQTVTQAGEQTRQALERRPVGGLFYNASNMTSREQVTRMLTAVRGYGKIPPFLVCDEEGGRVARLMRTVGTTRIGAMLSFKDQGVERAFANAETIGSDMRACGFNLDFAPVADVWSDPANTVIGDRAYSDDFGQAAQLIPAAVRGFHAGGVACTLKHFPGHGDTAADSHYGAVHVYKTLDELRREELLPFQAGIDAGADMVMIGHITVDAVGPLPALFSRELVTDLLREEMGFDGVVVTDALQMQALAGYSGGEVACKAVEAGVDLLLCPWDLDTAVEALAAAVESGEITEGRIDESVLRILRLKVERGILCEEDYQTRMGG